MLGRAVVIQLCTAHRERISTGTICMHITECIVHRSSTNLLLENKPRNVLQYKRCDKEIERRKGSYREENKR